MNSSGGFCGYGGRAWTGRDRRRRGCRDGGWRCAGSSRRAQASAGAGIGGLAQQTPVRAWRSRQPWSTTSPGPRGPGAPGLISSSTGAAGDGAAGVPPPAPPPRRAQWATKSTCGVPAVRTHLPSAGGRWRGRRPSLPLRTPASVLGRGRRQSTPRAHWADVRRPHADGGSLVPRPPRPVAEPRLCTQGAWPRNDADQVLYHRGPDAGYQLRAERVADAPSAPSKGEPHSLTSPSQDYYSPAP